MTTSNKNNENKANIQSPMLAVGLPVYNGEEYIVATIESILAQTFQDLVLIISDNASTDKTEEICRAYAAKDKRVLYTRNDENIGINANSTNVLLASNTSKYFSLIGHDDIWEPTFAEKIVSELEKDPAASLGFCQFECIDGNDDPIGYEENVTSMKVITSMKSMSRRKRISLQPSAIFIHGVSRRCFIMDDVFSKRYGTYEDVYYLKLMAGQGHFLVVPEVLFKKRLHQSNTSGTVEYSNDNKEVDFVVATKKLASSLDLTAFEVFSVWLHFNFYFRVNRPFVGRMEGLSRRVSKIIGRGKPSGKART